jgi:predicted GNAT superfamily acetyltransferase
VSNTATTIIGQWRVKKLDIRFILILKRQCRPTVGTTRRIRRAASKVARSGGLIGVDWIECRLWSSIRNSVRNAERDMPFDLRDVTATDLEAVHQLNQLEVPAVGSVDLAQMRWFADNAAYFRVATNGSDIVAFLIGMRPGTDYASPNYRWFCDTYSDFGYIDRIAVAESARRHGLATRMYQDFERSLPDAVAVLTCEVNIEPPNESSMRFHERFGFEAVGSQTTDGGAKEVALLAKDLRA